MSAPWTSGFCNPSNDTASHSRCRGFHGDTPCACPCHHPIDDKSGDTVSTDTTTTKRADLAYAAVLETRAQVGDLGDALSDLTPNSWEQAVEILHHLRLTRQTLATAESIVETLAARMMRDAGIRDPKEVDGIGVVQVRRGSNRKAWQHDDLAKQVIDTHLTDTDGEIPTPWEVRDWLLEALAPSYWRAGVLKSLGIQPDEYCETTPGRHTVQITTNDTALTGGDA